MDFKKIDFKKIITFIFVIVIVFWTISVASAFTLDGDDYFVMERGEERTANFVVIDGQIDGKASVGEGFISFEGGRNFYNFEKAQSITTNAVVVDYTINIPIDQAYDSYNQKILIESGGEKKELMVRIDIQNKVIAETTNFFKDYKKLLFWSFVFVSVIFIIFSISNMKIPIKKGNNIYILLLILLLLVAMMVSAYFIIQETNLYYKHPNDELKHTFDIRSIVGEDQVGGGYIILERNEKTPSALDMVSFEDGSIIQYFSITKGEVIEKTAIVKITDLIETGIYYYNARIVINKENFIEEMNFRVKV